jgi:hypothetical protein
MLYLVRFQVGLVYFFAGLAKLNADWLLHAQPLSIWFAARTDTPIIGSLLAQPWVAFAASWFAFAYDTTIVAFLLARRTRPFAYAVLLVFHALTFVFFDIGMFPLIMTVSALVFFPPEWPRRFLGSAPALSTELFPVPRRAVCVAVIAFCVVQVLLPLRHFVYPGEVLWNEQGMRFAWKVMVREKNGSVTFHVRDPASNRAWQVTGSKYLTWRQQNEMSSQPDLILQVAHRIADDFRSRGMNDVEVRAEAWVSLNGRAPALLIDPKVNLARVEDGLAPASWVLPLPEGPPLQAVAVHGELGR